MTLRVQHVKGSFLHVCVPMSMGRLLNSESSKVKSEFKNFLEVAKLHFYLLLLRLKEV